MAEQDPDTRPLFERMREAQMAEQEMLTVEQADTDLVAVVWNHALNNSPFETAVTRAAQLIAAHRLAATKAADERVRGLEARAASAEVALTEAEAERDAAEDRVRALTEHIAEQITHAETRIQDGIEMGAAVWRIALEDIVRENRAALTPEGES